MAKVSYGRPLPNWIFPDGVNLLSCPLFFPVSILGGNGDDHWWGEFEVLQQEEE